MKYAPIAVIAFLAFAATVATAQDTNFAVRISCDFQQQAGAAELPDLTLLQGSAPMIQAVPMRMGRAVAADSLTTCQLVFGPSATSTYYVATNAYLATNSAYYVQLGTIGTNSVPAGSNSPAAWWYSILYYRNGGIYWSGSGRLYIERTTATGANGLVWQEWEAGAAKDDIARGLIALLSNEVASIEAGVVNYGTATNTAFRGDWGASASNLAAQAAGWGDHAAAGYLPASATNALAVGGLSTTGTVSAGSFAFGDGEAITDWPQGTILGATINEPHAVATNDGLLAFTIGATGSGFPLTNDVSAAGYNVEQVGLLSASSVRAATDVYATNNVSARDLYARRNLDVAGNVVVDGNLVVSGNFTLIGSATNLSYTVVDIRTNVYGGTNYWETDVYRTTIVYQTTIVYTNIVTTNNVTTYVNHNGQWNATNAEYAWFPHLRDYRDGNAEAIGTWDFADASVSNLYLPPDAIQTASIAALADGVATLDLGSNWCWRLDASGDITAINFSTAGLKEGAMNANSVKGILLEVSRGSSGAWAWGGHLSHITNTAPPADAVSHLLLIGPSQDVTGTNGWAVY